MTAGGSGSSILCLEENGIEKEPSRRSSVPLSKNASKKKKITQVLLYMRCSGCWNWWLATPPGKRERNNSSTDPLTYTPRLMAGGIPETGISSQVKRRKKSFLLQSSSPVTSIFSLVGWRSCWTKQLFTPATFWFDVTSWTRSKNWNNITSLPITRLLATWPSSVTWPNIICRGSL